MYFFKYYHSRRIWDSSDLIITSTGWTIRSLNPGRRKRFSSFFLLIKIQSSSGAQTASYSMSTSGRFPGGKVAAA
jgi:hypothetical protein